jgi:hypothetical protein
VIELGSRERNQPAPPKIVFQSLTEPHLESARPWLELLDDEIEPQIVEATEPSRVVWSSLWPDRPDERITFDLRLDDAGCGCDLRWTLTTTDVAPTDSKLGHMRYRLNFLINERLRVSYGQ